MDGIVLIDKPYGPTSAQVSLWVSQMLGEKACHCGTLDPNATGVLPMLVGRAVKIQEFLQEHDKEYVAAISLDPFPGKKAVEEALREFVGKVYQRPPKRSAVAKRTRIRHVYAAKLLELEEPFALIWIECEHGFYVRSLASDLGKVLGSKASLAALRRTRVNGFHEEECITLTRLRDAAELGKLAETILPVEEAARGLAKAFLKPSAVGNIARGAPLYAPGVEKYEGGFPKGAPLAYISGGKLAAVGKTVVELREARQKTSGMIAKTRKVLVKK